MWAKLSFGPNFILIFLVHIYFCVIDFNHHGSMIYYNGNLVQFMVFFLLHPIYLHCLLNLTKLISYSILAITAHENVINVHYKEKAFKLTSIWQANVQDDKDHVFLCYYVKFHSICQFPVILKLSSDGHLCSDEMDGSWKACGNPTPRRLTFSSSSPVVALLSSLKLSSFLKSVDTGSPFLVTSSAVACHDEENGLFQLAPQ